MIWVAVVGAGAVGALVRAELSARLPGGAGTAAVNVVGAALLGLMVGLTTSGVLGEGLLRVVGTGFCGGLTTFSTWMVESLDAGPRRGGLEIAGQLVAGVLVAAVAHRIVA